jgi:uncharacterized protein (DUF4213/DUF364 family)
MAILDEVRTEVMACLGLEAKEATLERVVVGIFFTGVKLSTGTGGLCFTPVKELPEAVCCPSSAGRIRDPRKIQGAKAVDLLDDLNSREPLRRAIAVSVLNALSSACWGKGVPDHYEIRERMDAQELIPLTPDSEVTVIGALAPVLQKLKKRGGNWWVVEEDSRTLRKEEMDHYIPVGQSDEVIGRADILVITGVTLLNHTLEAILLKARKGADITIMGPTAGMLPGPLFARGVRVVGGVRVRRPDEVLDVLAAGGSGYHLFDNLAERIVLIRF